MDNIGLPSCGLISSFEMQHNQYLSIFCKDKIYIYMIKICRSQFAQLVKFGRYCQNFSFEVPFTLTFMSHMGKNKIKWNFRHSGQHIGWNIYQMNYGMISP